MRLDEHGRGGGGCPDHLHSSHPFHSTHTQTDLARLDEYGRGGGGGPDHLHVSNPFHSIHITTDLILETHQHGIGAESSLLFAETKLGSPAQPAKAMQILISIKTNFSYGSF